MTTSVEAYN